MSDVQDALRDYMAALATADECLDRFRDVVTEVLDLPENPGDDELIRLLRAAHGKTGEEPHVWRDTCTSAKALLERNGFRWLGDAVLDGDDQEDEQ